MTVPPTHDLAGLLAEDRWMRRLALRLAADPQAAEDLVQDAWVAALSGSGRPQRLRPWLGGILRHLGRELVRLRLQRRQREERAARGEALPSADELVEELELRQRAATALLELEEPFRRTLTLRYFHGRSLRAIAEAEGLSIAAIHEREQRGIARLRARLARDGRGRDSWAVALLALARPGGVRAGIEAIAMASGWKLAAAAVILIGGGLAWWRSGERAPSASLAAATAAPRERLPAHPLAEPAPMPPAAREKIATAPAAAEDAPAAEPPLVRGRLVDTLGTPLANLPLAWNALEEPTVTSRADGAFALPEPPDGAGPDSALWFARGTHEQRVRCAAEDWITLVTGANDERGERLVIVAPRTMVGGVVLGTGGAPLAGAALAVRVRDSVYRDLGVARPGVLPLDAHGQETRSLTASADALGRFVLHDVPGGPGLYLSVSAPAHRTAEFELTAAEERERVLVLEPLAEPVELTGLVLDASGAAVEGARVSAGSDIVTSEADGRFRLRLPEGEADGERAAGALTALLRGHLPARLELSEVDPDLPVVLQLGLAPLSIRGRVLDAVGEPRAGVVLWPSDPTPFGREVLQAAESMSASFATTVEDELAGGFHLRGTSSGPDGAFELGGLLDRTYQLLLYDPASAERAGPFEVAAGRAGVELRLAGEPGARVAGRIVTLAGEPLAGVQVTPQRSGPNDARQAPPLRAEVSQTTDAEGRFAFEHLCTSGLQLTLMHPQLFVRTVSLEGRSDLEHLELAQAVLCDLQVDLSRDPGLADELRVLDGEGQALELLESFGVGFTMGREARFKAGRSEVLSVRETARELVLLRGGVEVLRRPLELDPENRTIVEI